MKELITFIPIIVTFLGLAMWVFLDNPKGQEVGKACFKAGLLVVLFVCAFGK